jgi:GntR family transcriptional regulator
MIKDYVIEGIKTRDFKDIIPSENQLAEKFGVSRMTARKAIAAIERDGIVERTPGRGTFVKKGPHYTTGFFRVRPFQKWADDLNVVLSSTIVESGVVDPPPHVAKHLQTKAALTLIKRLWRFDGKPVRYEIRYLRPDICAGMCWDDLKNESIHRILVTRYKLPLTQISQSMEAIALTAELAQLFEVAPGYPAFFFKRVIYSFAEPVSYVEYTMRGEMAFRDTFTPQLEPTDFL